MKKLKMGGIKKLKIGRDNIIKPLIDKMLEPHNSNYEYILANETIDGKLWCTHFEWALGEAEEYKRWWIKFWLENVSPRYSKKYLETQWAWFNLQYGLRIKNEDKL